jgi:uncharacterized protein YukJ
VSKRLQKFVCECCGHFFDSQRDADEHERFITEQKERDPLQERLGEAGYMLDTVQLRRVVEFAEGLAALREGAPAPGAGQGPDADPNPVGGKL